MRLPGYLIGFTLAVLLAGTTPVGTGAGVHRFDLLHPLFAHLHLVNGRMVSHEELAAAQTAAARPARALGVAVDASGGGLASDAGLGVSPMTPDQGLSLPTPVRVEWIGTNALKPPSREEAPPLPPPL